MSSRPIQSYPSIKNGNMAASITSAVSIITNITLVSYDISWAGTSPVGTLTVQVSNTYTINADGSVRNAGTWHDFPGATASVSGNTGVGYFNLSEVGASAVRLVYTRASGTGTMQASLNGKVF